MIIGGKIKLYPTDEALSFGWKNKYSLEERFNLHIKYLILYIHTNEITP